MLSTGGNESSDFENASFLSVKKLDEEIKNISMPPGCEDLNASNFSDLFHSKLIEISDVNNTLNGTDYLLKEIGEGLKANIFHDKDLEREINNYKSLLNDVACARVQRNMSQFIVESLRTVFENSSKLSVSLKENGRKRIRLMNVLRNSNNSELFEAIGVEDSLPPLNLTADERRSIHLALTEELDRKSTKQKIDDSIVRDLLGHTPNDISLPGCTITEENFKVINLINETNETINSCFDLANSVADTIKELCDCHVQKFKKLHEEELNCLNSKTKLLELKLKNLNSMIENAIIQENDNIGSALDILHDKLLTILKETEYSLQKTESVKQSYDRLRGTRFDEILREFLEVRENMKHKLWALRQLKKTE